MTPDELKALSEKVTQLLVEACNGAAFVVGLSNGSDVAQSTNVSQEYEVDILHAMLANTKVLHTLSADAETRVLTEAAAKEISKVLDGDLDFVCILGNKKTRQLSVATNVPPNGARSLIQLIAKQEPGRTETVAMDQKTPLRH